MFKYLPIFILLLFYNYNFAQDCPSHINTLPMYGNAKKCEAQIESDNQFIAQMDSLFENRTLAAQDRINSGWEYYNNKDYPTAIKRFNQAWLLKEDMYEIYWGYANIYAINGKFLEAFDFFKTAVEYHPNNANFYYSYALAHSQFYLQNKKKSSLQDAIQHLEKAIEIDDQNSNVYSLIANIYKELGDYNKMNKYLDKVKYNK